MRRLHGVKSEISQVRNFAWRWQTWSYYHYEGGWWHFL